MQVSYLPMIAAALAALRVPGHETEDQTLALNRAIEALQTPEAAAEGVGALALSPSLDDISNSLNGALLLYTKSDDFKTQLEDAVKGYLETDAGQRDLDRVASRYFAEGDGRDFLKTDFRDFLESEEVIAEIRAAIAAQAPPAPEETLPAGGGADTLQGGQGA